MKVFYVKNVLFTKTLYANADPENGQKDAIFANRKMRPSVSINKVEGGQNVLI